MGRKLRYVSGVHPVTNVETECASGSCEIWPYSHCTYSSHPLRFRHQRATLYETEYRFARNPEREPRHKSIG
jgi:hypothetical protein